MNGIDPVTTAWRENRNQVIALLAEEIGLRPSQLAGLYYYDLYINGKPVKILTVPGRLGGKYRRAVINIKLSQEPQDALSDLNCNPLLFDRYSQPVITGKPIASALSARQISRIVKKGLNAQ